MELFRNIQGRNTAANDEKPPVVRERRFKTLVRDEISAKRAEAYSVSPETLQPRAQIRDSSPKSFLVRPRQGEAPPESIRSPEVINSLRYEELLERVQFPGTLSDSNKAPPEIVPSGLKVGRPLPEDPPGGARSCLETIKEQNEEVSEEARPQSKPAQEELPDLIDKFKDKEEEIGELERSLENLYNRRILEKEKFQDMFDNLERDNAQMEDMITELRHLRKRTDLENFDLQRVTVNMRRESNEVANAMAKLQEDNNHLSLKEAALTQQVHELVCLNEDMRIEMTRLAEECKRLKLEKTNLEKRARNLTRTLDNESSKNALKEHKYREEMEEKYIRQRIEHEELKATIKEKEEEISRKDSIYQELLQKNKAQKKVRMS